MDTSTDRPRTLPFQTMVRVRNLTNEKTVDVRIIDRGPFVNNRIIDLSHAAARAIEMKKEFGSLAAYFWRWEPVPASRPRKLTRAILATMPPDQSPNYFVIGASNKKFEGQRPFTV